MRSSPRPEFHLASQRLDLDETTPHLNVYIVPTYEKVTKHTRTLCVSIRQHFDKKRQLSALQDWIGAACVDLGLVRGRPRSETHARHVDPVTYRAWQVKLAEADADMALARGEAAKAEALRHEAELLSTELKVERENLAADRRAVEATRASIEVARKAIASEKKRLSLNASSLRAAAQTLSQDRKDLNAESAAVADLRAWLNAMHDLVLETAGIAHDVLSASDESDPEVENARSVLQELCKFIPPGHLRPPRVALIAAVAKKAHAYGLSERP